ncbi:hypothetical protein A1A1_18532 [Planococcus antarcticus DSM 14505]|uniref:Uncharacterized protein n=2 Tax=Planococcus TaxID=1372 RepID=A0AA87LPM3_9BACL|nr:hypothetical protein A1A1_18532 [Planococcus antarcticus DSM 14505]
MLKDLDWRSKYMENNKLHIISTGKQKPELLADIVGRIHPYIDSYIFVKKRKQQKKYIKWSSF